MNQEATILTCSEAHKTKLHRPISEERNLRNKLIACIHAQVEEHVFAVTEHIDDKMIRTIERARADFALSVL